MFPSGFENSFSRRSWNDHVFYAALYVKAASPYFGFALGTTGSPLPIDPRRLTHISNGPILASLSKDWYFFPCFRFLLSFLICFYTARSKQGALSLLHTGFLGSYNISETTILWQNQCLQGGAVMCFHHRMVNTKTSGYRRDVGMLLEINIT